MKVENLRYARDVVNVTMAWCKRKGYSIDRAVQEVVDWLIGEFFWDYWTDKPTVNYDHFSKFISNTMNAVW